MTFGEKLDTFDESRKDLLEFQDATLTMISSMAELSIGMPLYKVFPTKAYKDFVYGSNYILEYGMYLWLYVFTVCCVSWLKYLKLRSHDIAYQMK